MNSSAPSQADSSAIKHLSKAAKQHKSMLPEPAQTADNFQQLLSAQFQQADATSKASEIAKDTAPSADPALNEKELKIATADNAEADAANRATTDPVSLLQSLGLAHRLERASLNQTSAAETDAGNPLNQAEVSAQDAKNLLPNNMLSANPLNATNPQNATGGTVNSAQTATSNSASSPSVASQNQQAFSELLDSAKMHDARAQSLSDYANTDGDFAMKQEANIAASSLDNGLQNMQMAQTDNAINKLTPLAEKAAVVAQPASASLPAIAEYPGKSGWDQAIGQRVMMMIQNTQQTATISLNPPELGPLDIVIQVNNEQADTTFLTDRQEVRQALEDGMDNLRNMMKESGIALGQTNVGERHQQSFNRPEFTPQRHTLTNNLVQPEAASNQSSQHIAVRMPLGAIDTFI